MKNKKKLCKEELGNKQKLLEIINDGHFRTAIFGSARIQPSDTVYQDIVKLAENLSRKNFDIVTGGGPGAMEAASIGQSLAEKGCVKGQSIGINIELPFEQQPNKYLDFTETKSTFSARLDTFMLLSHVFILTPGGIGTLLELFYTWQLMQVGHVCKTPIILWGKGYKNLKKYLRDEVLAHGYMSEEDYELTIQVESIDQVLQLVNMAHRTHEKAGEEACVNIKQYIAGAKQLGLV
ncbi:LOG family protein [Candidatus Gracilibacteria bacterium]|nr:LOG family protein [Candidatus Gracilibacteria bacterium]